jgi:hypothetical protein
MDATERAVHEVHRATVKRDIERCLERIVRAMEDEVPTEIKELCPELDSALREYVKLLECRP